MLPTMGVEAGRLSLLDVAKDYIKKKYHKPGQVYLGIVSRLDAPVTGVLLMARTSKAASRLSEQFRSRKVQKIYHAIVEGQPVPREAQLEHWLRKDEGNRKMHVTMADRQQAQQARLRYRVLRILAGDLAMLEIQLDTGRKHQIRVQLSAVGHPVLGDRKYRSTARFGLGIALHAHLLRFEHPVRKEPVELTARKPASWTPYLY